MILNSTKFGGNWTKDVEVGCPVLIMECILEHCNHIGQI